MAETRNHSYRLLAEFALEMEIRNLQAHDAMLIPPLLEFGDFPADAERLIEIVRADLDLIRTPARK